MPESPIARAMREVADTIRSRKAQVANTRQLPFGQERLSKPEYLANRWDGMSKLERMKFIQENGVDKTMEMLRKGRDR